MVLLVASVDTTWTATCFCEPCVELEELERSELDDVPDVLLPVLEPLPVVEPDPLRLRSS